MSIPFPCVCSSKRLTPRNLFERELGYMKSIRSVISVYLLIVTCCCYNKFRCTRALAIPVRRSASTALGPRTRARGEDECATWYMRFQCRSVGREFECKYVSSSNETKLVFKTTRKSVPDHGLTAIRGIFYELRPF